MQCFHCNRTCSLNNDYSFTSADCFTQDTSFSWIVKYLSVKVSPLIIFSFCYAARPHQQDSCYHVTCITVSHTTYPPILVNSQKEFPHKRETKTLWPIPDLMDKMTNQPHRRQLQESKETPLFGKREVLLDMEIRLGKLVLKDYPAPRTSQK